MLSADLGVPVTLQIVKEIRQRYELGEIETTEDVIKIANNSSGFRYLKLDKSQKTAELLKEGMRLDLGGIGKGFALDEAFKVLISKGFSKVLVSAGGDILVGDPPPGKQGWKIALLGLSDSEAEYVLLENLNEDTGDQSLEIAVDLFNRMRRNISDRNTLYGYLSDDKWRDLEW